MIRSILVGSALAVLLLSGCSKSKSATESKSTGSAPAGSAAPTGSGSGSGADTTMVDAIVSDMMAYTEKVVPMMLAFDGDCAAQAKRMLELEPLAQKIRAQMSAIESDPAAVEAYKTEMAHKGPEVKARMMAKLEAAGTTEAAIDKAEQALKDKCGDDPAFKDAMNHVGLKKKS
jgi:hypothetical protein